MQVEDTFEVELRDVVVVEESIGGGRQSEKDGRRGKEEDGGEVRFNRRT